MSACTTTTICSPSTSTTRCATSPSSARRTWPASSLATMVKTHQFEAVTEITVLAQDHPRLLSVIAGACAAAGGNIVDAQIFTTTDGRALDTILISREFELDEDERRRAERVGRLIEDVLSGKTWLPDMIEKRTKPKRGAKAFRIEPRADIGNAHSNRFSVIEVEGPRPARPAVGDHRHAVGPVARHRLGPHHDVRREGGRYLLRHRPDRPADREPGAHRHHPLSGWSPRSRAYRSLVRAAPALRRPNRICRDARHATGASRACHACPKREDPPMSLVRNSPRSRRER